MGRLLGGIGVLIILAVAGVFFLSDTTETPTGFVSVGGILSDEQGIEGFDRALAVKEIRFPEDAGPHPTYQTEWWYYTGNLMTDQNRRFGYQLTFFRRALRSEPPAGDSAWRTNQVYSAHFAVTDVAGDRFDAFERFSRDSLGLAGARSDPYKVWLDDWTVEQERDGYRLRAREEDVAVDLHLTYVKPPVFHGNRGLSPKGSREGNASYYYSQSRIHSQGTLTTGDITYAVDGLSWLDHEWSTSALEPNQTGWDWFAIQLDDGRDVMLFQIRQTDGAISPYSAGSLIAVDGSRTHLTKDDFTLVVLDRWRSPITGALYPVRWQVELRSAGLSFRVDPCRSDQEHRHSFAYWEGAVDISGPAVSGRGYMELTGYLPSEED